MLFMVIEHFRLGQAFVRVPFRHAGIGTAAMSEARAFCVALGVRALHLEVEQGNAVAQRVYQKAGFVGNDRQLVTLRLAAPTHAPHL